MRALTGIRIAKDDAKAGRRSPWTAAIRCASAPKNLKVVAARFYADDPGAQVAGRLVGQRGVRGWS